MHVRLKKRQKTTIGGKSRNRFVPPLAARRIFAGVLAGGISFLAPGAFPVQGAGPSPASLIDPPVSYTADRTVTVDGKSWRGRVVHRPGQTVQQMTVDGKSHMLFLNRGTGRALILPGDSPVMLDIRIEQAEALFAGLPGALDELTALGQGSVAGQACTRYRISHNQGQGTACISAGAVILELEGQTKKGQPFHMTLENYSGKPPADSEFAPPGGRLQIRIDTSELKGFELDKILEAFSS